MKTSRRDFLKQVDAEVEKPDFLDLLEDVYKHVRGKKEFTAAVTPLQAQKEEHENIKA